MNDIRFPAESRLVDGREIGNSSQLVLLDVDSVLAEGTFCPPDGIPRRSRVDGQHGGAQDYCQWMGADWVNRVVQEDGEL